MKIELVSKQFHKFGGKLRKKGERFFATPAEAKALKALGRATPLEPSQAVPEVPEVRTKRAYKRRDMQAETAAEPAPLPVAPAPVAPEPEKSLLDEVTRVKNEFRARLMSTETLTRPKKEATEE
jgi:hypothetical protein